MDSEHRYFLTHMGIFITIFFCVMVLAQTAAAENITDNVTENLTDNSTQAFINTDQNRNALEDFSTQSKNFISQVKSIVPYEFWFFATISLFILLVFIRGGNQAYGGIWKLGLYFAIIVAVLWFLLSR